MSWSDYLSQMIRIPLFWSTLSEVLGLHNPTCVGLAKGWGVWRLMDWPRFFQIIENIEKNWDQQATYHNRNCTIYFEIWGYYEPKNIQCFCVITRFQLNNPACRALPYGGQDHINSFRFQTRTSAGKAQIQIILFLVKNGEFFVSSALRNSLKRTKLQIDRVRRQAVPGRIWEASFAFSCKKYHSTGKLELSSSSLLFEIQSHGLAMPVSPRGVSGITACHFRNCRNFDKLWIFRVGQATFKYRCADQSETHEIP